MSQQSATWRTYASQNFFVSETETGNDDTGVIATPGVTNGGMARFPLAFLLEGQAILTDETLDVTVEWFMDAAGGGSLGTTTFDQLVAATLFDIEAWPGDLTLWNLTAAGASRPWLPLPPFHKISWTLGGAVKSMNFIITQNYMQLEP